MTVSPLVGLSGFITGSTSLGQKSIFITFRHATTLLHSAAILSVHHLSIFPSTSQIVKVFASVSSPNILIFSYQALWQHSVSDTANFKRASNTVFWVKRGTSLYTTQNAQESSFDWYIWNSSRVWLTLSVTTGQATEYQQGSESLSTCILLLQQLLCTWHITVISLQARYNPVVF